MDEHTQSLPSLSELLEESWRRYKILFWPLMAVGGLGGIIALFAALVPFSIALYLWFGAGYSSPWLWGFSGAASLFAALSAATWAQIALMETALNPVGFTHAVAVYRATWKKTTSFSWVCFLSLLAAIGGVYLFIFPGIFLAFALSFAPFICLAENIKGVKALERSLSYFNGHWFGIVGRLIFISVSAWLLSAIPILGVLSGILTLPFALIFTTVLYSQLRLKNEPTPFPHARTLLGVSLVGLLIPALLAFRLASRWPQIFQGIKNEAGPFLSSHLGGGFQ